MRPPLAPFFSICIPQYERIPFVIECLKSIQSQTFQDFEICISDDSNPNNTKNTLVCFLENSGMTYRYRPQKKNRRYDGNLRTALLMAKGKYCFLMGNDDALYSESTLQELHDFLIHHPKTRVLISNYTQVLSNNFVNRVRPTGYLGQGQEIALHHFRNFSFLSGIVMNTDCVQKESTRKWDGSEMYQMYIGCRIISRGGMLSAYEAPVTLEGIQIADEQVDSVANKVKYANRFAQNFKVRHIPLGQLPALVSDALMVNKNFLLITRIYFQYYTMPCLYWLFEYKRIGGYRFYLEILLGFHPKYTMSKCPSGLVTKSVVFIFYIIVAIVTAVIPHHIFFLLKPFLHRLAKR